MKVFLFLPLIVLSTFFLTSCKKQAGQGGTSMITGVLSTELYNTAGIMTGSYPKANEDVFIIYGDGKAGYSDKTTTSYDGSFKFDYLETGKYSVYFYEDCATTADGKAVKILPAEITKRNSTIDLGTISIKKIKNSGTSRITGNIHVLNYNTLGVFVNEGPGPDIDVYLIYGTNAIPTAYTDKVTSNFDGSFSFPDLGKGEYTVYCYSKCTTCASGTQAVFANGVISSDNSTIDVGQITINN